MPWTSPPSDSAPRPGVGCQITTQAGGQSLAYFLPSGVFLAARVQAARAEAVEGRLRAMAEEDEVPRWLSSAAKLLAACSPGHGAPTRSTPLPARILCSPCNARRPR